MAPGISRNTETITFSLPPEQAQRLREVSGEEEREPMRRRSRQSSTDETEQGRTNEKR